MKIVSLTRNHEEALREFTVDFNRAGESSIPGFFRDSDETHDDCVMRFADGQAFRVDYLDIRMACPCAKCGPRQENEQRIIEFREEVMRLRLDKPKAELVGRYGLRFSWPSGCSILREVCEEKASLID